MSPNLSGRKLKFKRRPHLAIAVLPDVDAAFAAYRLLYSQGVSPEYLAIVGRDFNPPEWVGLYKPMKIIFAKAYRLGLLSALAGSAIAAMLLWIVKLEIPDFDHLQWSLVILSAGLMSGLCGSLVGALMGFFGEGNTSSIYRHHLQQGRYLLMIEGPEHMVRRSKEVLSQYSTSPS